VTRFTTLLVVTLLAATAAPAQIALVPVVAGLRAPVQVVAAHDRTGDLYIAQQDGRVLRWDGRALSLFLDLRGVIDCCANGGLLSVVFHPHYASNHFVFVQYVNRDGDTTIARYTGGDLATARVLLVADQPSESVPNHHGGTLQFGLDGFLYISIGDGVRSPVTNRAQQLDTLLGKLLRSDVDHGDPYAIPAGNPAFAVANARPEIWAYGLRNPWRFSFDRVTGDLLLADVGHDSFEEVNMLPIGASRAANFGWPIAEGFHCFPATQPCNMAGLTMPSLEYARADGCSVTGGYRYRGTRWSRFRGMYLYGDFCSGRIWGDGVELLQTKLAIVSFGEDDDGELYLLDYNGALDRIVDAAGPRRRVAR
jgi:glucose/arabinose dehydrogenase